MLTVAALSVVLRLVDAVSVDVVVGPRGPVDGHPRGVRLGVERARGGVRLVGVDGHRGVALTLEVRAPGLVSLVPVAAHAGVIHGVGVVAATVGRRVDERMAGIIMAERTIFNKDDARHALALEARAPGLVSLVPVAAHAPEEGSDS
eukprot:CAMPEP_0173415958 /NCGR_PEP_ID=MMETSP1356-20130122/85129_1 /TAXON_ID=77927 ORGANISM="Hemiselmis virescens, Strain PCC157" /NCGR_SAMPLE_ID=MMETSP1356 /ASSEMBLY_ACC=CAM_ASM_000847 /LENGTH=146 /DNA_ID=CAMNT_0014378247 /DNA_START=271 /DNA_END=712 /DNA_ORIENTATION=+